MTHLRDVISAISELSQSPKLVCIDGPAGAGKTTLGQALATHFPTAVVVHMDDLYDGWNDPLGDALTQRLNESILTPLSLSSPLRIKKYNWYESRFEAATEIPYSDLVIVEGVGAAQTIMRERAHVSIFVDIDKTVGRTRVLSRDGEAMLPYIDQWQIDEEIHLKKHSTRESCDFALNTDW